MIMYRHRLKSIVKSLLSSRPRNYSVACPTTVLMGSLGSQPVIGYDDV